MRVLYSSIDFPTLNSGIVFGEKTRLLGASTSLLLHARAKCLASTSSERVSNVLLLHQVANFQGYYDSNAINKNVKELVAHCSNINGAKIPFTLKYTIESCLSSNFVKTHS